MNCSFRAKWVFILLKEYNERMSFSLSAILAGLLFGTFGIYYFKKGKNEADLPLMFIGSALFFYPYFIENDYLLWGMGMGLIVLAYQRSV